MLSRSYCETAHRGILNVFNNTVHARQVWRCYSSHAVGDRAQQQWQYASHLRLCKNKQPTGISRHANMSSSVTLKESEVRQVITAALKSSVGVPQHSWSQEFVIESVLSDIASPSSTAPLSGNTTTYSNTPSDAVDNGNSSKTAALFNHQHEANDKSKNSHKKAGKSNPRRAKTAPVQAHSGAAAVAAVEENDVHDAAGSNNNSSNTSDVVLSADFAEILDSHMAEAGASGSSSDDSSRPAATAMHPSGSQTGELYDRVSQVLYDNYHQVESEDIHAFCARLVSDLSGLVRTALEAQSEDVEGLCGLCGRDMPLTKHHLIPRDVHKEFKKRGYTFAQLQASLMVCRPCHSAIHRAVPDNKQLALHYSTAEALSQHEEIVKFSSWASKQRVSSKYDATSKHFRYRR